MLNDKYKNALKGLKAQAAVVTDALPGKPNREQLVAAQRLMAENDAECKHIYRLVMKNKVSVVDLTESELANWLA